MKPPFVSSLLLVLSLFRFWWQALWESGKRGASSAFSTFPSGRFSFLSFCYFFFLCGELLFSPSFPQFPATWSPPVPCDVQSASTGDDTISVLGIPGHAYWRPCQGNLSGVTRMLHPAISPTGSGSERTTSGHLRTVLVHQRRYPWCGCNGMLGDHTMCGLASEHAGAIEGGARVVPAP